MNKKLRIILLLTVGAVAAVFVSALTMPQPEREESGCASSSISHVKDWFYNFAEAVGLRRSRASFNSCIANLKQIDGAKATWALENKKVNSDIPSGTELYGATNYIQDRPFCPHGGVYRIRAVGEKPTCTIPRHTL